MEINEETFSDFAALKQLTRSLWSNGSLRGASVLIGAGFSRGARLPSHDTPQPPLWDDLAKAMTKDLYGSSNSSSAPSDPLRLAEEFRTAFGDVGMRSFLLQHIADTRWEPGEVHSKLLDLPWTDVLTTNYDTLLERASSDCGRDYEFVRNEQDLSIAHSPRIIKLHGSIEDGASVVVSEEDYRKYPASHAPFVNTARQIFIENELCLLGFSGDDPNFLQWAGWVRDNLGGNARRIYLVGALNLPTVKRRMLEARNIIPIDFGSIIPTNAGDPHATASEMFLDFLTAGRPPRPNDWKPKSHRDYPSDDSRDWPTIFKDADHAVHTLRASVEHWRADRESYPGWLVCPSEKRRMMREGSNIRANLKLALKTVPLEERRSILQEIAWRYRVSGQPLEPWLAADMREACLCAELRSNEPSLVRAVAHLLLEEARNSNDECQFNVLCSQMVELSVCPDISAVTAYHRCLFASQLLDFESVCEHVKEVDGNDPIWGIRRATMEYLVGRKKDARHSFRSATRDLRDRCLRDPTSVSLQSRFSWARTLTDFLRWGDRGAFQDEIKRHDRLVLDGYDPKAEVRIVEAEIDTALKKQHEERDVEAQFEAGHYRDNRNTIHFVSAQTLTPLQQVRWLSEIVGIPTSAENVNVLKTTLQEAMALEFQPTSKWHLALLTTAPSYSKGAIDKHFNRIAVARLPDDAAHVIQEACERAIEFWRERIDHGDKFCDDALNGVRLQTEVLSRLAARATPEVAHRLVKLAIDLGCDSRLNHWWLYEQIGNLLKRSLESVPPRERASLTSDLLRFPTRHEKGGNGPEPSWPDPAPYAFRYIRRKKAAVEFDRKVARWIEHLANDGASKSEAAIRLIFLHEQDQLTAAQQSSFANALWKDIKDENAGLPVGLNLYPHSFLIAPSPPSVDALDRVYQTLFTKGSNADPANLVAAVTELRKLVKPSPEDAKRLFRNVIRWRPKSEEEDSVARAMTAGVVQAQDQAMADVLGLVAFPHLNRDDRTVKRAKDALHFYKETELPGVLHGLGYFFGLNDAIDRRIIVVFKRGLDGRQHAIVHATVIGLDRWLRLAQNCEINPVPQNLVEHMLRAFERQRPTGLANLVYLIRQFTTAGMLTDEQLERVEEGLEELSVSAAYESIELNDPIAISLSLIRAECVRLAIVLDVLNIESDTVKQWLAESMTDPLPEVRNAYEIFDNEKIQ